MAIKRTLRACVVATVAAASAATLWFAGAGTALAPEPARLDGHLSGTNSWSHAIYINTNTRTYAYQAPKSWTPNTQFPAGAPCADYNASPGTILPGVIVRSGNWARCAV